LAGPSNSIGFFKEMLPEPPGEITTGGRAEHPEFDFAQWLAMKDSPP
jgi:choline-glycine betaine transporter